MRPLAHAVLASALAPACGDAANPITFEGEVLDEVTCAVSYAVSGAYIDTLHPRAAVAWLTDASGIGFIVQPSDGVRLDEQIPGTLRVRLLDAPPTGAAWTPSGVTGALALGQVVVYDDTEQNGVFDPKIDRLVGVGSDLVITHSEAGASGSAIGAVPKGFAHRQAAACPDTPRLGAASTGPCTIGITKEVDALFPLACETESYRCEGLEALRWLCRWRPDVPDCTTCAGGIFPKDATVADCDAWLPGCSAEYPPTECKTEYSACIAGEPACDEPCLCQKQFEYCLDLADEATCHAKYDWCMPAK